MAHNVFAVTSGKGGVGKTTTTINLAVAVGDPDNPAVILDADLGMADVGTLLGLDPAATLHDVLAGDASIETALSTVAPGVDALAGAPDLERFPAADPDGLASVLEQLADRYRYVFVDTGGGLSYEAVLPLELADAAVLVTSPNPAAIDNTKKSTQLADRAGVPIAGAVVTRSDDRADPESIAAALGVELLGAVPDDPRVRESADCGQSLLAYAPDSDPAAAYRRIAVALLEALDHRQERGLDAGVDPDVTDSESGSDSDSDPDSGSASAVESDGPDVDEPATGPTTGDSAPDPDVESTDESEPDVDSEDTSDSTPEQAAETDRKVEADIEAESSPDAESESSPSEDSEPEQTAQTDPDSEPVSLLDDDRPSGSDDRSSVDAASEAPDSSSDPEADASEESPKDAQTATADVGTEDAPASEFEGNADGTESGDGEQKADSRGFFSRLFARLR